MKINQLFCRHIYVTIKSEHLYDETDYGSIMFPNLWGTEYEIYAVTRKCLKCGKINIIKKKYDKPIR